MHVPAASLCSLLMLAVLPASAGEPPWWMQPQRLLQTNLREIDARMEVETYVEAVKDSGANVVLFNTGGIVANYPTSLPFHYRNPNLQGDLAGEVVRGMHAAGIRVLARFDFSKVNEEIIAAHPEWQSRDRAGQPYPPYNGQVPTCLNSWYQQEGMLQILGEVIDRYPVDGVFFNMIGYPSRDYSGRKLGICQCDNCRTRFRERHQLELPVDDQADPVVLRAYAEFTASTTSEQFQKVNAFIKGRNPDIFICTYTPAGVDVIRKESSSALHTWRYEESYRVRLTALDYPDKQLANAAVHFPRYSHRHSSVAPSLTRQRLFNAMVSGGWLDFYCIGPFHLQEDRLGLDEVRDIFRFHAANEKHLVPARQAADVAIAVDTAPNVEEIRGLIRILSQEHISWDFASLATSDLENFPALMVPDIDGLKPAECARLDAYVEAGGRLLLTGGPVPLELTSLGVKAAGSAWKRDQGTYLRIRPEDKARLASPIFDRLDLLMLDGDLWMAEVPAPAEGLLRYIPPAMIGPPEKCYYTRVSDIPALYHRAAGRGTVTWIPWLLGTHFEKQGHAGHAALLVSALDSLARLERRVRLEAPAVVEMNHRIDPAGGFEWVSLYNHSGEMDQFLGAPVPLRDLRVTLRPRVPVQTARLLRSGQLLPLTSEPDGSVNCTVPELGAYDIVLFAPSPPPHHDLPTSP